MFELHTIIYLSERLYTLFGSERFHYQKILPPASSSSTSQDSNLSIDHGKFDADNTKDASQSTA